MEKREWCGREMKVEEELPTLLRKDKTAEVFGFDSLTPPPPLHLLSRFHPSNGAPPHPQNSDQSSMMADHDDHVDSETPPLMMISHQRKQSISMPSSPTKLLEHLEVKPHNLINSDTAPPSSSSDNIDSAGNAVKFLSQPMPRGSLYTETNDIPNHLNNTHHHHHPAIRRLKDDRYNSFKTWSGRLERQFTRKLTSVEPDHHNDVDRSNQNVRTSEAFPVDRYYDALEGPELETLRPSEEIVLPDDKPWPFLLRFPISAFGMCLGLSSQAIMWKTLATAECTKFLHIPLWINKILWFISVALVITVASIYLLKLLLFFEAVRREYYHPIRVNFFFAPFISLLFLALGVPPSITTDLPHFLWYILMFPFLCLELKIYGQWMSGGQRRLSKVANPTNHLSVVGNFVGALLGASMGIKEGPIFFYAVGIAHYLVLFVTLYQRLPSNETLPKELHPVFFLFVAAPSVASMAWAKITGSVNYGSKICYFIAMFLYFSLAVRINFFRGFKFSLAWWAYTFPMTGAAVATIRYADAVRNPVTQVLSVILSVIATLIVTGLLVTTIIHAFVFHALFPNDIAIAISDRKSKPHSTHSWFNHLRNASSEHIEQYLKFTDSVETQKDLEAANDSPKA